MQVVTFDKNIYKTIKKNIKGYRMKRGLTSAQLAEMIDVSHEYMRQLQAENDKHNCSFETLYKICVALEIKIDDLLQLDSKEELLYQKIN